MNGARSCNSSGMWALLQRSAKNGTFDIECTRRPNPKSKKTECCDFGRGPGGCGGQRAGGARGDAGVTHDTLKPGDKVIVVGNPGRNPADHRIRMQSIERPSDGWKWAGTFG